MKCFHHPVQDAVGTCTQCGRATCHQCIQDIGGPLHCVGCLSLTEPYAEFEEQPANFDTFDMQRARNRIRWSWIVGALGLVVGIFPGLAQASEAMRVNDLGAFAVIALPVIVVFFIILTGYMFWSMFWGAPVVWRWTRSFVDRFGLPSFGTSLPVWLFVFSCLLAIPLSVALYYSVLGGGIYQYFRCRRIAAGTAQEVF